MKTRIELLQSFNKNLKIAELGVFKGDFSSHIFEICQPSELYLVDLFDGVVQSGDVNGENIEYIDGNILFDIINNKFNKYPNIFIKKQCSIEFLNSINSDYLDIVYIDSSHQYEHTKAELNLSFEKVKKSGFICGHDYDPLFGEVVHAVDEFCKEKKLELSLTTDDGLNSFYIHLRNKH